MQGQMCLLKVLNTNTFHTSSDFFEGNGPMLKEYLLVCIQNEIYFEEFCRGLMLVMGRCWLLYAFAFCWMWAYSVESVWFFYYMIVYFILWSFRSVFCTLECMVVYFARGDRFLTEANISQANPATNHNMQYKIPQYVIPQYAIPNTT